MARPTKNDINSGNQGWDGEMDDNDEVLFNGPFPMHQHTGNESDLASTYPANQYDRCWIMVNHSTLGWTYYVSDGTNWQLEGRLTATAITALTDSTGGTANDTLVAISGTGDDADINNNFADLVAKINALRTVLVNNGMVS